MKTIAVIMAGGRGERFWPRSRAHNPKQFLSMTDDGKSMIELTVERLNPLVKSDDVLVVTNKLYKNLVKKQLPKVPSENIIYEPVARNTAPAIGLAAVYAQKKYGDAVMVILPSDHLISDTDTYLKNVSQAVELAKQGNNLVTIGIVPSYPETGYGYLQYSHNKVVRFVEKPDIQTAQKYVNQGDFLWNSGQFFWKVSVILDCFKRFSPVTYEHLVKIEQAIGTKDEQSVLEAEFPYCVSESIDHGIMEKSHDVYTVPGTFDWDDVGSWLALERTKKSNSEGNVVEGNVFTHNTKNCIIQGQKKLISTVGLQDIIVIDTEDALFICRKDQNQDVKKIIEQLKKSGKAEYL